MGVSPFCHSDTDMALLSLQPIADKTDHIYEHGCQATRKERKRVSVWERERSGGREKIAMLLPRGGKKPEQDGLIAFHRCHSQSTGDTFDLITVDHAPRVFELEFCTIHNWVSMRISHLLTPLNTLWPIITIICLSLTLSLPDVQWDSQRIRQVEDKFQYQVT